MKHEFGGIWTRKKLELLENYIKFYTTALKNFPFTLHFVDAFAGTGFQSTKTKRVQSNLIKSNNLPGSATIALKTDPPFDQYHFNDLDSKHTESLRKIADLHPEKKVNIYQSDANSFVTSFCNSMQRLDRAIIFIDPYSTELDWETLIRIANTKKADLWLLFPLSALLRMTPKDGAKIRSEWREKINRLLGTPDWQHALYREKSSSANLDLFDDQDPKYERINVDELSSWLVTRLEEVFAYTATPVTLKNNKGAPLFLFLFAVSNPSDKAKSLANRVVKHIIQGT